VAGYAISFSPPKSTSVLWVLADEATAAAVREAHDSAVEAALGFLQDHAGFTRRGKAGAVQADTDGYLAAAFTHRTSRVGDPQLHTHVLIANNVRACSDVVHPGFPGDSGPWIPGSLVVLSCAA